MERLKKAAQRQFTGLAALNHKADRVYAHVLVGQCNFAASSLQVPTSSIYQITNTSEVSAVLQSAVVCFIFPPILEPNSVPVRNHDEVRGAPAAHASCQVSCHVPASSRASGFVENKN